MTGFCRTLRITLSEVASLSSDLAGIDDSAHKMGVALFACSPRVRDLSF